MDHFTKWVDLYAIDSLDAITVARRFLDFICKHGVPDGLLSDQGRNFESQLFAEVLELLDVHKMRTTPYHPQCDGQTEGFNRTLIAMLKVCVNENQDDWDELLNKLAFAYRTAVHSTTGFTPFELVYGREPKLPIDIFYGENEQMELSHGEYVKELKNRMTLVYDLVKRDTTVRMDKSKILYDRNVKGGDYDVGDRVWLQNTERKKGQSPKLAKNWKGPYEVLLKIGQSNYKIKLVNGKKKVTVHKNRLKRCFMVNESEEISSSQAADLSVVEDGVSQSVLNSSQQIDRQNTDSFRVNADGPNEEKHDSYEPIATSMLTQQHNFNGISEDQPAKLKKRGRPRKNVIVLKKWSKPLRLQPQRGCKRL